MAKFSTRLEGPLHVVYDTETGITIKECLTAREAAIYEATEKAGDVGNLAQHLLKKYGDAHLFTACMGDEATGEYDQETRAAVCARVHHEATGKWPTEKEVKEMDETEKADAEVNNLPDSAFLYVESGGDKDEGGKTVPRALRHLPYRTSSGAVDLPRLRNALSRLGQRDTGKVGGEKWLTEAVRETLQKKAQKVLADNTDAESAKKEHDPSWIARLYATIKGDVPGHEFHGNQYGSGGGSGGSDGGGGGGSSSSGGERDTLTGVSRQAVEHVSSRTPKQKKADIEKLSKQSLSSLRQRQDQAHEALSKHTEIGKRHEGWLQGRGNGSDFEKWDREGGALSEMADDLTKAVLRKTKELEDEEKEGRRNSNTDAGRLQQIHDLSVENGASCPMMITKDAKSGKARWVLVSTNAYEDRDGEYVSRKAQKRDVARMNETKEYGPLRLWHLGYPDVERKEAGPGVDIGDCDYSEMFGKFRVESGTFRNERVAAAIKERADRWATSVGFFHPQNEPDPAGVYHEIYTFERSLLPRTKASNYLTPLAAILKELDMTTKEEKVKGLSDLLGDEALAKEVLGQVDKMEKDAAARGLTYKQAADAPIAAEKGDKKDGDGKDGDGEPDEDDMSDMDEMMQKNYKAMLPHILKAVHNLTKKSNIIGKEERKAAKKEKKARKEYEAKIKELATAIAELKGDLPRGLAGGAYRPSQTGENLITLAGVPTLKENVPDPLGDFMAGMGMAKYDPTQPGGNGQGR